MTETNPQIPLPAFFDRNPEFKQRTVEYLATLSEEEKRRNVEAIGKFISGELTWAEIKNIPRTLLKELAKFGYSEFKRGDYRRAEIMFKGLSVIDHTNWYYRAGLGAVYQKQGLLEQAIAEYGIALSLQPDEVTTLVNRGQCFLKCGDLHAALADFEAAGSLPLAADNPWIKRARLLAESVRVASLKREA